MAISTRPIRVKLLVECKRYTPPRTVTIEPVRQLHGVCRAEGATKGILVTTAKRFTKPAEDFLARQEWLLEGKAFDSLVDWLAEYQGYRMKKDLGLYVPDDVE